MLKCVHFF
jgi:hypothetical protein